MKGIRIVINDKFTDINQRRVEESDAVALTTIRASRIRLQQLVSDEKTDIDKIVNGLQIEMDVLSYAAERYADINEEDIFNILTECVEDYKELRDELLSMKE